MELEEQMMRLAGGAGAAPYQSYGYLPPTMPVQNDPNLMLGTGGGAPANNNAIGLNKNPKCRRRQKNGECATARSSFLYFRSRLRSDGHNYRVKELC